MNNTTKEIHAQVDHILYVRNFDRAPVFETAKNKKILPKKWYYLRKNNGVICANKRNIVDYCYNAMLSFKTLQVMNN